jgi:hypothetical protein
VQRLFRPANDLDHHRLIRSILCYEDQHKTGIPFFQYLLCQILQCVRFAGPATTINNLVALRGTSTAQFYADLKRGRVEIRKLGRKTVVPGPIAKAYIEGRAVG